MTELSRTRRLPRLGIDVLWVTAKSEALNMSDTALSNPSSARLRPVSWSIWLAWVLVSALTPAFSTISATALNKPISRTAQHPELIANGMLAVAAFTMLAPPIVQGLVLKRVVPRLSVGSWLSSILVSAIAWLALTVGRDILHLQSGPSLFWTAATSALTSLIPAWTLGRASGLRRMTSLFVVASIAGACASTIVEQLYYTLGDQWPAMNWALNGRCWTERFEAIAVRTGVGAVGGATAAIFVVLTTRRMAHTRAPEAPIFAIHRAGGTILVLIAPLLIAVLAPFAGYLAGPRGVVVGAPEFFRAISLAPSLDKSQGETVLSYSHDVTVPVARMPAAVIAPDSQSAIVRTIDGSLMQVDLATGHGVRQLAGGLAPLERHAIAWSPDGRYLALRSNGAEVPIPNTHYTRHQSRVRLYALPDLTLAGEFSSSGETCFDTFAREPMLFSGDGKSLWLACGQFIEPKPDDLMAIGLDVPAMRVRDLERYGEGAESGQIRGLERIGPDVWAWQFPNDGKPLRIRDLTHDREIVAVSMPSELIGELTWQTAEVNEETIWLNFCGAPARAGPASWICRALTFDTRTGTLLGSTDGPDYRASTLISGQSISTLAAHGLRIEASWRNDSKAGELIARDSATGHERQRILSIAQRPLQISDDGRWLMTVAVYGAGLRLYRIHL